MKKGDTLLTLVLVSVFLLSFASAGWFSDGWNFITGKVIGSNDLIAQYSFEDNYKDSVSGSLLATSGPVSFTEGYSGKGVLISSGYLFSNLSVGSGKPRTYALMVKTSSPGTNYKLMGTAALQATGGWVMGSQYPEAWAGTRDNSATGDCTANDTLRTSLFKANEWTSLVVTYDDSSLKEYVNGVLVKTCVSSKKDIGTGTRFEIGKVPFWYANFVGSIDEVKIFNRALTETEVKSLSAKIVVAQNVTNTTNTTCTDSDGGVNYYVKGTLTPSNSSWATDSDTCTQYGSTNSNPVNSSNSLLEFYCDSEGKRQYQFKECSCVDGACVNSTIAPICIDSDGGLNYYSRGTVTVPGTIYQDYCNMSGSNVLIERTCDSNNLSLDVAYNCPNGCVNYACVNSSGVCNDEMFRVRNIDSSYTGYEVTLEHYRGASDGGWEVLCTAEVGDECNYRDIALRVEDIMYSSRVSTVSKVELSIIEGGVFVNAQGATSNLISVSEGDDASIVVRTCNNASADLTSRSVASLISGQCGGTNWADYVGLSYSAQCPANPSAILSDGNVDTMYGFSRGQYEFDDNTSLMFKFNETVTISGFNVYWRPGPSGVAPGNYYISYLSGSNWVSPAELNGAAKQGTDTWNKFTLSTPIKTSAVRLVRFGGYASGIGLAEFRILPYNSGSLTPCEVTTNFMKAPSDITIENTEWRLGWSSNWSNAYEKDYQASFYQSTDFNSNSVHVMEIVASDVKTAEARLQDAMDYGLCQKQKIYSDTKEDFQTIYLCKNMWDVAYQSRNVIKQRNSNNVDAVWISGNKIFRVTSYEYDYNSCSSYEDCLVLDEQNHRNAQLDMAGFLGKLVDNQAEPVQGFYLGWEVDQFVKYFLRTCNSDIVASSNSFEESWSCKTEPAICPPHGEQKQTCMKWNDTSSKYDTKEATISCNPGLCSGCMVPKWFDSPYDSKCIPYGSRFKQQTGWTIKDVFQNYTKDETLTVEEANQWSDLYLEVYANNTALFQFNPETGDSKSFMFEQGKTYMWDESDGFNTTVTVNKIAYISGKEECWPIQNCWDECWDEEICVPDSMSCECGDDSYSCGESGAEPCGDDSYSCSCGDEDCYPNTVCQLVCDEVGQECYPAGRYEDSSIALTFKTMGIYQTKDAATFNAFCDIDGQIKQQKSAQLGGEWAECQNNYECSSNLCSDGVCVELKQIASELKGFKGFLVKMLCKLSNPFSDDGYNQCVSHNI